jgi:hypothetical protein
MKKALYIYLLLILVCPFTLVGQIVSSPIKLLAKNDSMGVQVIKAVYKHRTEYYLIFNKTDSMLFHSLDYRLDNDPLIYEEIIINKPTQLDGIRKEEINLQYICNNSKKREYIKMEFVINLDTKQKVSVSVIVTPPIKLLEKNDSMGIQVIKVVYDLKTEYYLIFNKTDSILFRSLNYRLDNDPSIFEGISIDKPIQLDGIGKEEIRLFYVCNNNKAGELTKTAFIFNLDTKQKIFEGKYDYRTYEYYENEILNNSYSYHISFDKDKNLIIDYDKYHNNLEPDQKEGIYSLVNGKYIWIKSQFQYSRKTIVHNDSLGIKVIQISRCENPLSQHFLFFNNDSDSIPFRFSYSCIEDELSEHWENYKITSTQLDNMGSEEIIIEYSESSSHNRSRTDIVIFNVDTKKIIFRGCKSYFSRYEGEMVAKCPGFACNIQIHDSGNIIVTHSANNCMNPELKEGVYTIQNGIYTWIKNK